MEIFKAREFGMGFFGVFLEAPLPPPGLYGYPSIHFCIHELTGAFDLILRLKFEELACDCFLITFNELSIPQIPMLLELVLSKHE